jgi:hypothetical protein
MYGNVSGSYSTAMIAPETITEDKITLDGTDYIIDSVELYDDCIVDGHFVGSCVARKLIFTIDSSIDLAEKEIAYSSGLEVNGAFEYIPFGNFIVVEVVPSDTQEIAKVTCLDYMLKFNVEFKDRLTYPCTMQDLFLDVCSQCFVDVDDAFYLPSANFVIENNVFVSGEQCRDVLKAIIQTTGGFCKISRFNKIKTVYLGNDGGTTYEESDYTEFKQGTKEYYTNVIVIRNSQVEGENFTIRDDASIQQYGEYEFTLNDNPFAYTQDKREQIANFIYAILSVVPIRSFYFKGLGYSITDSGDLNYIANKAGGYTLVNVLSFVYKSPNLFESEMSSAIIQKASTKYQFTPKKFETRKTEIMVDKANQRIDSVVSDITELGGRSTEIEQTIDTIINSINRIGGINLVRNSVGLFGTVLWEKTGSGSFDYGYLQELISVSASGARLKIKNCEIASTVDNVTGLVAGRQYTVSFKLQNEANTTFGIEISSGIVLAGGTIATVENLTEYLFTFVANSDKIKIKFTSSTTTTGSSSIVDLMMNEGKTNLGWQLAVNETVTEDIVFSFLGLIVRNSGSEFATLITSQGFDVRRYVNKVLGEIVTSFNKDGTDTKKLSATEVKVGYLVTKNIDDGGVDTYITYIA